MCSKKSVNRPEHLQGGEVIFLNPHTCGIYKSGGVRYKVDPTTGKRTREIHNELAEVVDAYLARKPSPMIGRRPVDEVFSRRVLVPRYFDDRWNADIEEFCGKHGVQSISLGKLIEEGKIQVEGGHGSPSNDQRTGDIPYIKVSDIRSLRVNVNPTNLVSRAIARSLWGGETSGLAAWDLVTPNRASSNIGEFAILLPGEEQVVLTKEVFVVRVRAGGEEGWDPFYLLWAFSLRAVRRQWQRITLMQTNREDCGNRFLEVRLPRPPDHEWATHVSAPFREYFTAMAAAKADFVRKVSASEFDFIANVSARRAMPRGNPDEETRVEQT